MKPTPAGSAHLPLLILVSDEPDFSATVRGGEREIHRWSADGNCIVEHTLERCFTGEPTDPATYRWTQDSPDLSAVVDLQDEQRAAGAIDALRRTPRACRLLCCTRCRVLV